MCNFLSCQNCVFFYIVKKSRFIYVKILKLRLHSKSCDISQNRVIVKINNHDFSMNFTNLALLNIEKDGIFGTMWTLTVELRNASVDEQESGDDKLLSSERRQVSTFFSYYSLKLLPWHNTQEESLELREKMFFKTDLRNKPTEDGAFFLRK